MLSNFKALEMDRKINLRGYGLNRKVVLNGHQLRPEDSLKVKSHSPDGFNWGYTGSGPAQLALAILLATLTEEEAVKHYQTFKFAVVAQLPQDTFEVDIYLDRFLQAVQNPTKEPQIHAYSLLDIHITDIKVKDETVKISKFLDFPHINFGDAEFAQGTIEHLMLTKMHSGDLNSLKAYLRTKTERTAVGNPDKKIHAEILMQADGSFKVINNLGSGEYTGHEIGDYVFE